MLIWVEGEVDVLCVIVSYARSLFYLWRLQSNAM